MQKKILKNKLNPVNFIDTAGAAKFVSENEEPSHAAIASDLASQIYKLKILIRNFQDSKNNITRFLVFSKKSMKINKKK